MPMFVKSNWTVDTTIPGLQNSTDIVFLIGAGSGSFTLNATDTHTGIEGVLGGSGNDILNGGSSQDYLVASAGSDVLNAGGGDDFLSASNQIGQSNTYATTTFNGGSGLDTLVVSGDVDFQGIATSIEHLRLMPAVAATGGSTDRKSTRLNSSHTDISRMPSSA